MGIIIKIHESTDKNFESLGLGAVTDIIEGTVTESLNGEFELEFTYPITGNRFRYIKHRNIIFVKPTPFKQSQPFRIYSISTPIDGIITVNAEHISYDLSGVPVKAFKATSASEACLKLKSHSLVDHPFTFSSDIVSELTNTNIKEIDTVKPQSARSILGNEILGTYEGELTFDKFNVILNKTRGNSNGVSVRYGKNMLDVNQESNCSNVYTAVYPFWYSDKDDVIVLAEIDGKFVKTPGTYNYTKIYNLDLSSEFEEKPSQNDLIKAAEKKIEEDKLGIPKISFDVSLLQLSQSTEYKDRVLLDTVHLGDFIDVEFEEAGVIGNGRCVRTVYDIVGDKYVSLEIGDAKKTLEESIVESDSSVNDKIENNNSFFEDALNHLTDSITGNSGGYVRLFPATNPSEIVIMDTEDVNTSVVVWRWNKGGLGVSTTGYNGPYTGICEEGKLVVNEATVRTINAALVNAGILSSFDKKTWINLDTGTFNLADKIIFDGKKLTIDLGDSNIITAEDVDTAIAAAVKILNKEIQDVNNKINSLGELINGSFADGLLTEAEKISFRHELKNLEKEKSEVDAKYDEIYNNRYLS